ncbi:MAG: hypothetical protein QOJ09_1498 [Actinomycetota bacterium]|jgi:hypothetical protein|nr:hypothetical protein [Actinomycetota bacterium]
MHSAAHRLAQCTALLFGVLAYLLFLGGAYSTAGLAAIASLLMVLTIRD